MFLCFMLLTFSISAECRENALREYMDYVALDISQGFEVISEINVDGSENHKLENMEKILRSIWERGIDVINRYEYKEWDVTNYPKSTIPPSEINLQNALRGIPMEQCPPCKCPKKKKRKPKKKQSDNKNIRNKRVQRKGKPKLKGAKRDFKKKNKVTDGSGNDIIKHGHIDNNLH